MQLPDRIENETQLDEFQTTPSKALVDSLSRLQGDLLILGVAGKMGPTLARLARRALDGGRSDSRVIGVARFSDSKVRDRLESQGIDTITADLLDTEALRRLPDCPNIIYLAARKFGSTGDEPYTWAMNTLLPALVADRFRDSRIVALSTGNVYPLSPVNSRGPTENDPTGPIGEYAQSCLGRERLVQYFSRRYGTPCALVRLNYAIDLRYGVLLDIAQKVKTGQPVPLGMGHVNVIWQGDANSAVLGCLEYCASPPFILNLTSPQAYAVRWIAEQLGSRLGKKPVLEGTEAPTALLSNAARYVERMGPPLVGIDRMLDWVAHWVAIDGPTHSKPTHFETRDGRF